ncbi:M1 family peptidase, partial [Xanthomonas citri pv. citri]|nr:M1 family peptidase [Xanthomonas citri pv. citri]
ALTVEALRQLLGADLFGSMLRAWVREHRFGTVDSLGLRTHVHAWAPHARVSRAQVDELFDAWTLRPALPPFPG